MSASLFGGIVTGVVSQIFMITFASLHSWLVYVAVWALSVLLGAVPGGAVLKATLGRFDYRISYHGAVAALFAGQIFAAIEVWFRLALVLPTGVVSLIASVVVVWYVARFTATRSEAEPL